MRQSLDNARLFIAVAQSNLIGVAFGLYLASTSAEAGPVATALVFTFWLAASWWVWTTARRKFWPEDFH